MSKHGSEPPLHMSPCPSMRRKVAAPMYTMDMTRAKTVNNIEEQQLTKKLLDLEKQQSKMQSEIMNLKAALLPEIKVTSAWEDKSANGTSIQPNQGTNQLHLNPPASGSQENQELSKNRGRSGSLPPLAFRKQIAATESIDTGTLFTPIPPSKTGGIQRSRSMNAIDGRVHPRPKSAHTEATEAHDTRRRSTGQPKSQSLNSSTEILSSDTSKTTLLDADRSSTEDVTRPRAQTLSSLLPIRKTKSTTNISKKDATPSRRVTVDTADLTRLDKDSIFKNSCYNPVLLNPSYPHAAKGAPRHRRATSPVRLSYLSRNTMQPTPPAKSIPSLQDQFEQLKACRYLRLPSDESD